MLRESKIVAGFLAGLLVWVGAGPALIRAAVGKLLFS
jgi:hypothetical protein